jgi:hypothetical protein
VAEGSCENFITIDQMDNSAQPFIFAVGPPFPTIQSDSYEAGLSRHMFYGHFTMDLTAATSEDDGVIPAGPYVRKDASDATDTEMDNDPAPRIHGLVMGFVFVIAYPLGALLLRVWNMLKAHIFVQVLGLVLFCMAFAGGCVVSGQYIRSKNFDSAHQVLGILLLIALFAQLALGFVHHAKFKKTQQKTIFGKIHLYLGPISIAIGIINGFLGFRLAGKLLKAFAQMARVLTTCRRFVARDPIRHHRAHLHGHLPLHSWRYCFLPPPSCQNTAGPRRLPISSIRQCSFPIPTRGATSRISATVQPEHTAVTYGKFAEHSTR